MTGEGRVEDVLGPIDGDATGRNLVAHLTDVEMEDEWGRGL